MPVFPTLGTFKYGEPLQTVAHSGGGALAVNVSLGTVVVITLTSNITSLSFTNWASSGDAGSCSIVFVQGGGGGFTVGWDAAVLWAGGTTPTITATAAAIDVLTFFTVDGGTSVYGFVAGQDMS